MTHNNKSLVTKAFPLAVALGIALVAPSVSAEELQLMSGTACHPNRADAGKINYSSQWGVFNENTTSAGTVYCPVPYNTFTSAYGARSVHLTVYDQNSQSGKDISCTANGLNENGTIGFSSGARKTAGASSSAQIIDMDLAEDLIYNVICSIPPSLNGAASRVTSFGTVVHD